MLKLPHAYTPTDRILWDVVEEHLNEAAFEYQRWSAALRSPRYTLPEVAAGPEEYLLAHLSGVMLGGQPCLERLILPCLNPAEDQESELLAVAAAVAFCFGYRAQLIQVLLNGEARTRRAVVGGLRLCKDSSFDTWVVQTFQQGLGSSESRTGLLELAAERRLELENLEPALRSCDPAEAAGAARAAMWSEAGRYQACMEELSWHPHREVRLAALTTALTWGSARAFQVCLELMEKREEEARVLLDFVALLGGPPEHELLLPLLVADDLRLRYAAIRAVGLSGSAHAVQPLIELLEAEDLLTAKLAGEAIHLIAGLDVKDPRHHRASPVLSDEDEERLALSDLVHDDCEADDRPAGEIDLPYLDAAAVTGWWSRAAAQTATTQRLLLGRPLSPDTCLSILREGSMRSRWAIATCISIRSAGRHRLHLGLPSGRQLCEVAALRGTSDLLSGNRLLRW